VLPTLVAGHPATLLLRLQDGRGLPVPDGILTVLLEGAPIGSAEVRHGLADPVVQAPASHASGAAVLELSFGGTTTHAAAVAQADMHVLAPVSIKIRSIPFQPGEPVRVELTVTRGGQPLPSAELLLEVEGLAGGLQATTGVDGQATLTVPSSNGTLRVAARFAGMGDLAPGYATASLVPVLVPPATGSALRLGTLLAGGSAVVVALGALLAYRLRRHTLEPALRRALRALVTGRGPYATQIFLAYRILEDAAIGRAILEGPAHTPRLMQEAIAPTLPPAAHGSLDRLIALFEQARYGKGVLGPEHRDAAVQALRELRAPFARMDRSPAHLAGRAVP
ncbi:MAG: DUF4129 domain-containing protein, partial [Halobacteriales archaeon]|nr:DUF4129 domain-containing protein [Halobacteriales archaeon]